uniref:Uncharacterized protein n=1 Tax=Arion vulgaris TaxID=1028688 RepID=A0A0B7B9P5_9EUPU
MLKKCSKNFGNGHSKSITTEQAAEAVLNESKDKLDLEWDYSDKDTESELDDHLDKEEMF